MTDTSTNALFIITSATNAPYRNELSKTAGLAANYRPVTGNPSNSHVNVSSDANHDGAMLNNETRSAGRQPENTPSSAAFDALMDTVNSINTHAPGSRIAVVEYSAYPLTQAEHDVLIRQVDYLMDYSGNEQIQSFDRKLGSSQLIAAFSELSCLLWFLQLGQHHQLYQPFKRIFKVSSGLRLAAAPQDTAHFAQNAQGRYVFPNATLASNATGALALQFSNDFWSMDTVLLPSFIHSLEQMLEALHEKNEQGQPVSLECLLYKCLDAGKIFYDLKPAIASR